MLKYKILEIFGPRPEDAIERALNRVLTGKPSQLARALVRDLCKQELEDCECCPAIISTLWKRQLSSNVCAGIAHLEFNHENFSAITKLADDIHSSDQRKVAALSVAAVSSSLDETQPAIPYATAEVAAVRNNRGGNRGGRGSRGGGRGRGRGSSNSSGQDRPKGSKHPDLPSGDQQWCSMHFRHGKGAYFCASPSTCPWKNVYSPRPASSNNK